jgi:hypothetical protein
MEIFTVAVGFSTVRPIVPEQHTHHVIVAAQHPREAQLVAAQMVGGGCEMVTSTRIVSVEI